MASLMLSAAPPSSLSAAIAIVLAPFIEEREGPKRDWRVRLDGKWLLYKGVEQRLRDRYERDESLLKERLVRLEAFGASTEARMAAVAAADGKPRLPGRNLSSKQIERLKSWKGELFLVQDLDRYVEIVLSAAESQVKRKGSAAG
jgi:hypothetical protein